MSDTDADRQPEVDERSVSARTESLLASVLTMRGSASAKEMLRASGFKGSSLDAALAPVAKKRMELERQVEEEIVERAVASRAWVINKLVDNVEKASQLKEVTDREGNPIGVYQYYPQAVNQALHLIGQALGMFTVSKREPRQIDQETARKQGFQQLELILRADRRAVEELADLLQRNPKIWEQLHLLMETRGAAPSGQTSTNPSA